MLSISQQILLPARIQIVCGAEPGFSARNARLAPFELVIRFQRETAGELHAGPGLRHGHVNISGISARPPKHLVLVDGRLSARNAILGEKQALPPKQSVAAGPKRKWQAIYIEAAIEECIDQLRIGAVQLAHGARELVMRDGIRI